MFKWENYNIDDLRKEYYLIGVSAFCRKYKTSKLSIYKNMGHIPKEYVDGIRNRALILGVEKRKREGSYGYPSGYIRKSKFSEELEKNKESLINEFHSMNVVQFTKKWGISSSTAYEKLGKKYYKEEIKKIETINKKEYNYWEGIGELVSYGPLKCKFYP